MSEEIYQRLRRAIGKHSETFDASTSGVEIKFLKKLFTVEEAEMYMHLTGSLETPEQIASRAKVDPATAAVTLKGMAEKGLLFPKFTETTNYYAAAPFAHGILEHQVLRLDRELAEYYEEYMFAEKIPDDPHKVIEYPLRTLPVKSPINVSRPIQPYENVRDLIMKQDRIALAKCFCAEQQRLLDNECHQPLEVCLILGFYADYYVELGWGRRITQEEALNVLEISEAAGLVHQFADSHDPGAICNCCPDCCGGLRVLRMLPNAAEIAISNHYAQVDMGRCDGCESCVDRCPMDAISLGEDQVASINLDRCLGCGLCIRACPSEALMLVSKPEEARREPPLSGRFMRSSEDMEGTLKKTQPEGTK